MLVTKRVIAIGIDLVVHKSLWRGNGDLAKLARRGAGSRWNGPSAEWAGCIQQLQRHGVHLVGAQSKRIGDVLLRALRGQHGECRNDRAGKPVQLTRALVGSKEERILHRPHGATHTSAKLILAQQAARYTLLVEEEVVGIQILIAEEFIQLPVILLAAALGDHVHISAGRLSLRSIIQAGLHAKLFDRIRRGHRH